MKILHLSDIHAKGSNLAEVKTVCSFIVNQAREENPDLIIHAGDTFDRSDIDLDSQAVKFMFWFFSALADVAPVSVILGTPSHDGHAVEVFEHIRAAFPIHVSDQPEQLWLHNGLFHAANDLAAHSISKTAAEAIISCIPAPTKRFFQTESGIQIGETEIAQGITRIMAGFGATAAEYDCPHILNGHFSTTKSEIAPGQILPGVDIQVSMEQMALGNFDLGCIGHIHLPADLGDGFFHSGTTQSNNWGEVHPCGFYIHESDIFDKGDPFSSRFIETPSTKMIDMAIDYTKSDPMPIMEFISSYHDYEGTMVRLRIKIFVDEVDALNAPFIEEWFKTEGAELTLEIIRMPRENVRSQRIQDLELLYDKVSENAEIIGENVPAGIKEKCERLEAGDTEALLEEVRAL